MESTEPRAATCCGGRRSCSPLAHCGHAVDAAALAARDDRSRRRRRGCAAIAPGLLQRSFGIPANEITGSNRFGWRLFAVRNLYLTSRALEGDAVAIEAFGRLQVLDHVVFWHAFAQRSVPRRTAVLAAATSAAIVGLDRHRRSGW